MSLEKSAGTTSGDPAARALRNYGTVADLDAVLNERQLRERRQGCYPQGETRGHPTRHPPPSRGHAGVHLLVSA
jgi:hypothetical protein